MTKSSKPRGVRTRWIPETTSVSVKYGDSLSRQSRSGIQDGSVLWQKLVAEVEVGDEWVVTDYPVRYQLQKADSPAWDKIAIYHTEKAIARESAVAAMKSGIEKQEYLGTWWLFLETPRGWLMEMSYSNYEEALEGALEEAKERAEDYDGKATGIRLFCPGTGKVVLGEVRIENISIKWE